MKKHIVYSTIIIALFFVSCNSSARDIYQNSHPQELQKVVASLAGQELELMLARTSDERMRGLMFFDHLEENHGMLFVYDEPQMMSFWMRNTKIELDLVFFCERLKITEWIESMQPGYGKQISELEVYKSRMQAQYALELPAGSVERMGLEIGDKLIIPLTVLYSD